MIKNKKIIFGIIGAILFVFIIFLLYFFIKSPADYNLIPEKEKKEINNLEETEETEENIEKTIDNFYQEIIVNNEISDNFEEAVNQLDVSNKLIGFLNKKFNFETRKSEIALQPEEFFKNKKGNEIDFAVFVAHVLDYHKYETGIIQYRTDNNQQPIGTVIIFRDKDLPKYIFFNQGKTYLLHHGWSFEELFQKEDQRLSIQITEFAIFYPNVFDLTNKNWVKRNK